LIVRPEVKVSWRIVEKTGIGYIKAVKKVVGVAKGDDLSSGTTRLQMSKRIFAS
jgi:hypothetical protein